MKKLTLILASLLGMVAVSMAHGYGRTSINSYADAFVFDEMGITFSVYPDGEFDFYLPQSQHSTTVSNGYVSVTFNSGYNYNPYVQYDDFGAVIQVENVPVWYDHFGRVTQIGDVLISYRNRRIHRVGGLYVFYNRRGHYAYHTGYINRWNPYFVYRPFYVAFVRPAAHLCFVRPTPYRQYYAPVRYTYYRPYVHNMRPSYATIGHTYRPRGGGVAHQSYRQQARRGEVAFKRQRQEVTRESVRQQTMNLNTGKATRVSPRSTNATRSTGLNRSTTPKRSAIVQQPQSHRADNTQRAAVNSNSTRQQSVSRSHSPNMRSKEKAVQPSSVGRNNRTETRNAARPSVKQQSRGTTRSSTAIRPNRAAPQSGAVRSAKPASARNRTVAPAQSRSSASRTQTRVRTPKPQTGSAPQRSVTRTSSRSNGNVKATTPARGANRTAPARRGK